MKMFLTVWATVLALICTNVYAATETTNAKSDLEMKDNGGYTSSSASTRTTKEGTKHTTSTKVDVDIDKGGKLSKEVTTEITKDPQGLMNKQQEVMETVVEEKSDGGLEQVKTREYKDNDGTNVTTKSTVDVDVDDKGNVIQTVTDKKTVDPKGLLNQTTTETTTKIVNGRVVKSETKE